MVGRYLARFDETVLFFFPRCQRKKKTKKKKRMEESEVIKGKANQGNNFDTQTFDTEKFLLVFKK